MTANLWMISHPPFDYEYSVKILRHQRLETDMSDRPFVRFVKRPTWLKDMKEDQRKIFDFCFGKVFPTDGFDQNGHVIVDVSELCDPVFGGYGNELRLDQDNVEVLDCLSDETPSDNR